VTSLAQTVRTEGQAETAGTVTLSYSGTANATIVAGSSITVSYSGATVTSPGVVSGKITNTYCNVASSSSATSAPGNNSATGTTGDCGYTAAVSPPQMVYTASGSNVIIQFNNNVTINPGDYLNIQQVRLNIAQVTGAVAPSPSATTLNATLSGNSPTSNPITFTNSTASVATISTSLVVSGPGTTIALTTCAAVLTPFTVTISEVYPAAFTSQTDEAGFTPGNLGPPAVTSPVTTGSMINIVLYGVPAGLQVQAPTSVPLMSGAVALAANAVGAGLGTSPSLQLSGPSTASALVTSTGITAPITFTYTLVADSTASVEKLVLQFLIGAAGTSTPATGPQAVATLNSNSVPSPTTITAQAYLGPQTSTAIPRFTQLLYPGTAVTVGTVADCNSILLFPYVTNQVGFDTSIQIANTSADAAAFGTQAAIKQTGVCKFTLYSTNAQTGALGSAINTYSTPPIAPGGAFQVKLSTLTGGYAGNSGYMYAVCQFLNAHAYSYFVGPGSNGGLITQGALALVINPNTRTGFAGESLTH